MTVIWLSVCGTVAASANILPGHPLYPVRRWTETIEVLFSSGASDSAFRHAELAGRLDEVKALTRNGEDKLADQTISVKYCWYQGSGVLVERFARNGGECKALEIMYTNGRATRVGTDARQHLYPRAAFQGGLP